MLNNTIMSARPSITVLKVFKLISHENEQLISIHPKVFICIYNTMSFPKGRHCLTWDTNHQPFQWTHSLAANVSVTRAPYILPTRFLEWVNTLKHFESCGTFISAPRLLCPGGDTAVTLSNPMGSCGGLEGSWLLLWLQWDWVPFDQMWCFPHKTFITCWLEGWEGWRGGCRQSCLP